MNPNGLVAAVATTFQTSTPSLLQMMAISFARAMLTARKVFSSSLATSATAVDETGTTVSTRHRYNAVAISRHAGVTPLTTLGVFLRVQSERPGSIRSG